MIHTSYRGRRRPLVLIFRFLTLVIYQMISVGPNAEFFPNNAKQLMEGYLNVDGVC